MHHIKYFRDKASHFDEPPSPIECLACILALRDIMENYKTEMASLMYFTSAVEIIQDLLKSPEGLVRCVPIREDVLARLVAEFTLEDFAAVVGNEVRVHFQDQAQSPSMPIEISELAKHLIGRNGGGKNHKLQK